MAVEIVPLPLPASADPSAFHDFGREVKGVDAGNLTPEQFAEVEEALYKASFSFDPIKVILNVYPAFSACVQRHFFDT